MGAHSKITGQKYLPVGINAESWTENMGISHEYHSAPRRRTRGGISGKLRLAGGIVALLLVAYAVTAILEKGTAEEESTPQTGAGGIAQNILAPLPMQGEAASGSGSEGAADSSGTAQAVQLESFGPARQTDGAYTIKAYDASVIRQPTCGQVDLSYFSDAAFLGDSLTVGFSDYQINLSGALICGYTGVGPDAIVNRAAVKSPTRGQEVALDVLAAAQPKKLYILLGTNTLTTLGASDRFLAYYGQMLDELRQTLGNDCIIYVQSIPPVRPAAAEKKPALRLDNAAREKLMLHPWSGNIRELEHAIEKAVIICDGAYLSAGLFQLQRRNEALEMPAASTLEDMEKQMIRRTLDKCGGNLSAVASQLGITRQTLYNKMKKYGL